MDVIQITSVTFTQLHKLVVFSRGQSVCGSWSLIGHRVCSTRTYKVIKTTRITFTFSTLPNNEVIWVYDCVQFITFRRLTWAKLIKFRTTSISWEKDIFEAERLTFDEWHLWEHSCNKQFSRSEDTALCSILPHHHFLRCPFESVPRFIIRAVVRWFLFLKMFASFIFCTSGHIWPYHT